MTAVRPVVRIALATFLVAAVQAAASGDDTVLVPSEPLIRWNAEAAAGYLDSRADAWIAWPKSHQADQTSCISCHTVFPYVTARPALQRKLRETGAAEPLEKHVAHITKRVNNWQDTKPWYSFSDEKTEQSRSAESVFNAMLLAVQDTESGTRRLSDPTKTALANMWAAQRTDGPAKGSWVWLDFKLEPWESAGAEYWGATLAAIATGIAPANYAKQPDIAANVALLRSYLVEHLRSDSPNLHNRAMLLWASCRLEGLLDSAGQQAIANELVSLQKSDGGWSMDVLGDWKVKNSNSDAYATGLCAYVLGQLDGEQYRSAAKAGCRWLAANQQPDGAWASQSLNKARDPESFPGQFMQNAATAFAVMALVDNE